MPTFVLPLTGRLGLIGTTGTIYAVDRDEGARHTLVRAMQQRISDIILHTRVSDSDRPLPLPPLDGSLHL